MGLGGFCPFPRRFGRTRGQPLEVLTGSLLAQLGTAYDSGTGSKVWAKAHATARALWDVWETERRLRNQFDPARMTSALSLWESVFHIIVPPDATPSSRRAAVALRFPLIGKPARIAPTHDLIASLLPRTFVGMVYGTATTATTHVAAGVAPDGGITTPAGTVTIAPSGTGDVPWSTSVHSIHVQVAKPAAMSEADFYAEVGTLANGVLRRFLPSWVKFNWFRDGTTPGAFILDDAHNLDNERLS